MPTFLNFTKVDVQNEELYISSEYMLVSMVWSGSISELPFVIFSFKLHIMILVIFYLIILIRYAISLALLLFMLYGILSFLQRPMAFDYLLGNLVLYLST